MIVESQVFCQVAPSLGEDKPLVALLRSQLFCCCEDFLA